jgi:hypothetical protein
MSKKTGMLVLLALVAVTVVAVGPVGAQITDPPGGGNPAPTATSLAPVPVVPAPCYVAAHDFNGDKRVNEVDFNQWKRWFLGAECRQGAGVCPPQMDVNRDGQVTFADLNMMLDHYRVCVMTPRRSDSGR